MELTLKNNPLTLKRVKGIKCRMQESLIGVLVFALLTSIFIHSIVLITFYADSENIPITGEAEFDAMYQYYMEKDMPMLQDIMEPANYAGFFVIKLVTNIVGLILIVVSTITFASAIAFGLRPDLANEVHEVKMEVAAGQQIPMDEPIRWLMRFLPDVKAASGIAEDYEYENPTIGLVFRDNIWKFLILYTLAIALRTNLITTFLVKTGGAMAYGVRHYVDNTDMRGIINTWTTAGKDYNPRFDTLTTEGRNKKKVFNAMYNALKNEKPRDRTDVFLGNIGSTVYEKITSGGISGVNYSMKNFSASADILAHDVTPDTSEVKVVQKFPLSELGMIQGQDYEGERYLYLTVMQYEDRVEKVNFPGASSGVNNVTLDNSGFPTKIDLSKTHTAKLTDYKFKKLGDGKVTATVYYSGNKKPQSKTITLNITDDNVTADLSSLSSLKPSGGNEKWTEVKIGDFTKAVHMVLRDGSSKKQKTTEVNSSSIVITNNN